TTGFFNPLDIRPPEVERHCDSKKGRERIRVEPHGLVCDLCQLIDEPAQVLARTYYADRSRQNVVEDKRRHRQSRHDRTHRVSDNYIDTAPDKHSAAFGVNRTNREAE